MQSLSPNGKTCFTELLITINSFISMEVRERGQAVMRQRIESGVWGCSTSGNEEVRERPLHWKMLQRDRTYKSNEICLYIAVRIEYSTMRVCRILRKNPSLSALVTFREMKDKLSVPPHNIRSFI